MDRFYFRIRNSRRCLDRWVILGLKQNRDKDISKKQSKQTRWYVTKDGEKELLNLREELQPLPESPGWDIRYYDSLQVPSEECSKAAEVLLYGLQNANVLNAPTAEELKNTRSNKHMADNTTACGYHVLHFIETEMRRSLGEGEWPCCYNVGRRVRLLQGIWRKFRRPKPATNVLRNQLMLENA